MDRYTKKCNRCDRLIQVSKWRLEQAVRQNNKDLHNCKIHFREYLAELEVKMKRSVFCSAERRRRLEP